MNAKKTVSTVLRMLLLTLVMAAAVIVGAMVSGMASGAAELQAGAPEAGSQEQGFGWLLLVCLLEVAVLGYLVMSSRGFGLPLAGALFLAVFGLNTVLPHIDSFLFLSQRLPEGFLGKMVVMGLVQAAIFAPAAVWLLGRGWASESRTPAGAAAMLGRQWPWKLALIAVVYVALYFTFGYYVAWQQPAVLEYYGGSDPGSFSLQMAKIVRDQPWLIAVQLGRGLLWVLFVLPLVRTLEVPRWQLPLAVALLFAVWSFVLLMPNPLMPEAVARTHLVETLASNFLFGAFVGWLLLPRAAAARLEAQPATA